MGREWCSWVRVVFPAMLHAGGCQRPKLCCSGAPCGSHGRKRGSPDAPQESRTRNGSVDADAVQAAIQRVLSGFKQLSREKGSGREEEEEGSSCGGGSASYPSVEACLTCRLKRGTGAVLSYTALPQSHPDDQDGGWRGQEQ